ncbi:hypothetical protein PIB30_062224 [Stylosanthes scabra]|uniref:Uncharacterized protein n=1 Tax=Stylosanthes scabra TaxID=79078 RepID=A0ABU6RLF4_9FABA|nr:hypothetical protein [Stylosanthes scabra]
MKMANLEISVACSKSCYEGQNEDEEEEAHNNNKEIKEEEKEEIHQEGIIVLSKQQRHQESRKDQEEQEVDEDGFKTPTSMDQRIPIASQQCPPAPRKPKPPLLSLKRKQPCSSPSPSSCCIVSCRFHPLDLSKEVDQLLFPRTTAQQNNNHHQLLSSDQIIISKKIRREEETTL